MAARPTRRATTFTSAALADLERLASDNPALPGLALRKLREFEKAEVDAVPLQEMAKTGDVADCRKLYFGPGLPPSHRIVVRVVDEITVEVVEVVVIETRDALYAYLLAASRLGRLPHETAPEFTRVHQAAITRRGHRKKRM